MRGPHQDVQKNGIGIEIGIGIGCGAYGCIVIEVVIVVGLLWIYIVVVFGGRLMCVGFVVEDLRFVSIMFVGRPNTSDETHAFMG